MTLTTTRFASWLAEQATALPPIEHVTWYAGPRIEDKPDELVTVDRGVSRPINSGVFEQVVFTLRARGAPFDPDRPIQILSVVAQLVWELNVPGWLDQTWVAGMWLQTGPLAVAGTPDLGQRFEYVASYQLQLSL